LSCRSLGSCGRSALLALALQTLLPQAFAQGPDVPSYPSLRFNYLRRLLLWVELTAGERREEGLALGESVLEEASLIQDRVFAASLLSKQYVDFGNPGRGKALLDQATREMGTWRFRGLPESGQGGHWKHWAMYHYNVARWRLAEYAREYEEARIAARDAVASADSALALARYANRPAGDAEDDSAAARVYKARADFAAGRLYDAQAELAATQRLVEGGAAKIPTAAFFYRAGSELLVKLGEYENAIRFAQMSAQVSLSQGASATNVRVIWARNALQNALVAGGRWEDANAEFDAIDKLNVANPSSAFLLVNLMTRALAYAHAGRLASLTKQLEADAAGSAAVFGQGHPATALRRGLHFLAAIQDEGPRSDEALRGLSDAVHVLIDAETRGDSFSAASVEDRAARYVLEQYLVLATRKSAGAAHQEFAFQVAEMLRQSVVQSAVSDAAIRASASSPRLQELVRQEQDLRNQLRNLEEALAGRLGSSEPVLPMKGPDVSDLSRLDDIAKRRAQIRYLIAREYPEYEALVRPKPPTVSDIAGSLRDGRVFISFVPGASRYHSWVITNSGAAYRDIEINVDEMRRLVSGLRQFMNFDTGGVGKPYPFSNAFRLYSILFGFGASQLSGSHDVIVAAAGDLASVPFAALTTSEWNGALATAPWLIDRVTISNVPSASTWLMLNLATGGARAEEPLAAWGDPLFDLSSAISGQVRGTRQLISARQSFVPGTRTSTVEFSRIPPLPETRAELLAIANAVQADPASALHLGADATRKSVLDASSDGSLRRKRIVAFATHGLQAGDLPELNQPALALAATSSAATDVRDSLLTLEDVLTLKLNADWVVLSACNTDAGDGKNLEALSGLARGFMYAGSRSLLVTHWAVETESAKRITTALFAHYAANPTATKSESLRASMLALREQPGYAHPAYWAAFSLVGDGTR
jgi:CHAT domain-containing protein